MRKAEWQLKVDSMKCAADEYRALWEASDDALKQALKSLLLTERDLETAREEARTWEKMATDHLDAWEDAQNMWAATKRELEQQLKDAQEEAWLAERRRILSLDYQALPAFYEANTHCPKCGSSNLGTEYIRKCEPTFIIYPGRNEQVRHYCIDCGAELMCTKTLEASRG